MAKIIRITVAGFNLKLKLHKPSKNSKQRQVSGTAVAMKAPKPPTELWVSLPKDLERLLKDLSRKGDLSRSTLRPYWHIYEAIARDPGILTVCTRKVKGLEAGESSSYELDLISLQTALVAPNAKAAFMKLSGIGEVSFERMLHDVPLLVALQLGFNDR